MNAGRYWLVRRLAKIERNASRAPLVLDDPDFFAKLLVAVAVVVPTIIFLFAR
jgi:hypothetical protein